MRLTGEAWIWLWLLHILIVNAMNKSLRLLQPSSASWNSWIAVFSTEYWLIWSARVEVLVWFQYRAPGMPLLLKHFLNVHLKATALRLPSVPICVSICRFHRWYALITPSRQSALFCCLWALMTSHHVTELDSILSSSHTGTLSTENAISIWSLMCRLKISKVIQKEESAK